MSELVFGYGSLVSFGDGAFPARLRGYARGWGVAMDNRVDLPGYKYYADPDGGRPAVYVAFLDLRDAAAEEVLGVCVTVDSRRLRALDLRERNYRRVDVTEALVSGGRAPGRRVWAYIGTDEARARLWRGREEGIAVVHAGYLREVQSGFCALGAAEYEAVRASLDPGGLPVRELVRHELR